MIDQRARGNRRIQVENKIGLFASFNILACVHIKCQSVRIEMKSEKTELDKKLLSPLIIWTPNTPRVAPSPSFSHRRLAFVLNSTSSQLMCQRPQVRRKNKTTTNTSLSTFFAANIDLRNSHNAFVETFLPSSFVFIWIIIALIIIYYSTGD